MSETLFAHSTHHLPIGLVFHMRSCLLCIFRCKCMALPIRCYLLHLWQFSLSRSGCCCRCCCVSHLVPLFACDSIRIVYNSVSRARTTEFWYWSPSHDESRWKIYVFPPFHRRSYKCVCLFLVQSPISAFFHYVCVWVWALFAAFWIISSCSLLHSYVGCNL